MTTPLAVRFTVEGERKVINDTMIRFVPIAGSFIFTNAIGAMANAWPGHYVFVNGNITEYNKASFQSHCVIDCCVLYYMKASSHCMLCVCISTEVPSLCGETKSEMSII